MPDWFQSLGDAVIHAALRLCENRTPRQIVGIFSVSLAALMVAGTVLAVAIGRELAPIGWYFVIPATIVLFCVSIFCFTSDG